MKQSFTFFFQFWNEFDLIQVSIFGPQGGAIDVRYSDKSSNLFCHFPLFLEISLKNYFWMNSDANWPKSSSRLSCSERDLIWIIVSTAWRETVIWKKKQPDRFSWISKLKVSELIANEFVNEMSCEHEQFFIVESCVKFGTTLGPAGPHLNNLYSQNFNYSTGSCLVRSFGHFFR